MTGSRTKLVALLAVAVVAVVVPIALAAPPGGNDGATTQVSIGYTDNPDGDDYFAGTVISSEPICEVGRPISVYRKKRGDDKRIGGENSSPDGFQIDKEDPKDGKYYAVARRYGNCGEDKSGKVKVSDDPNL